MTMNQPYFEPLDIRLGQLPDDGMAMNIFELDGFVAALLLRPSGEVTPGQWLPHVWGACGDDKGYFPFSDFDDMQRLMDLVVCHHNEVAARFDGANYTYKPIFMGGVDPDFLDWGRWMVGFGRGFDLHQRGWQRFKDDEASTAIEGLLMLRDIADGVSELDDDDIMKFNDEGAVLIPKWVRVLADARRGPFAANDETTADSERTLRRKAHIRKTLCDRLTV